MDAVTFQTEAMRYERLLYRVNWSMLGSNEDCADAVQEALTRAWQKRDTLRSMDAFRPWLMRILTNTCKDMLRRRKHQRFVPLDGDEPVAYEPDMDPEPLREAMRQLSPEQRVATTLFYLEGYTIQDIAQTLALPSGTVKSRLMYARRRLKALLRVEWEDMQ